MWLKVDDRFIRHPKVRAAASTLGGRRALGRVVALWLEVALYSADQLTDGFFPDFEIDHSRVEPKPREVIAALVSAGLAHQEADGIRLHDFTQWNPAAADIKAKREWDVRRKQLYSIPGLIEAIRERDGNQCRYCGRVVNWKDRRSEQGGTYDHVQPRGANSFENVVVCCLRCNNRKGSRTPIEAGMPLLPAVKKDVIGTSSDHVGSQFLSSLDLQYPDPTRPVPMKNVEPEEPRGARRARVAQMSLGQGRTHLLAAVHALIESGPPYVDLDGRPVDSELLTELKTIAARDLGIEWEHARELGTIVDSVVGARARRAG